MNENEFLCASSPFSHQNIDLPQCDGLNSSEMVRLKHSLKKFSLLILWVVFFLGLFLIITVDVDEIHQNLVNIVPKIKPTCKDWHDYKAIVLEEQRSGPGEHGDLVELTDSFEINLNEKFYNETGFSVVVSDKISVNRSILDARPSECKSLRYLKKLPKVSVIIIFHNEVKSILLRTVHSVINRTPPELLQEIILVNDNSTENELYEPLQQYVKINFPRKVKIKNLNERKGLIVTRLEGARIATGEVLVFFDSHIEVGINWLPPLLDPIARNRRLATVPVIDDFDSRTFQIYKNEAYGSRGGIDWMLIYRSFERYLPEDVDPIKPFPIPVMLGCAFAIDRKFFLDELRGYDEGFKIWNGENYELSFKLWLCADGLFEVPCSRVTHSFRLINPSRVRKDDFVGRNFKRLVEVWFDEYKDVVYAWDPNRYKKIDAGDLTKQIEIRQRLNCKPFRYFINEIAPDIFTRYPTVQKTPVFASGQIRSLKYEDVCVDTFFRGEFDSIGLYYCNELDDAGMPPQSQFFRLNFMKGIVYGYLEYCLDSYKMSMPQCSNLEYGNQYWRYDHIHHLLINGEDNGIKCLTGNFDNQTMSLMDCDVNSPDQKWSFTYVNETALNDWKNIYGYKKFVYGDEDINYKMMMPLNYSTC